MTPIMHESWKADNVTREHWLAKGLPVRDLTRDPIALVIGKDEDQRIARARLIAAAPKLLLACRGALACIASGDLTPDMALRWLRQAIALAEKGETL